jgi:hypothetical protein
MLLAGIAINALAGAGLGFLSFVSTDEQLRNLQMWLLGSLGASRWSALALVSAAVAVSAAAAGWLARPLNAIALARPRPICWAWPRNQAPRRDGGGAGRGRRDRDHGHHRLHRPGRAALGAADGRA